MRQFRQSCVTIPEHAHPTVRFVIEQMKAQRIGYYDLADRSGVDRNTIRAWRSRNAPTLAGIEAVLGALGYELRIAPKRDG